MNISLWRLVSDTRSEYTVLECPTVTNRNDQNILSYEVAREKATYVAKNTRDREINGSLLLQFSVNINLLI
jgi:hypothetical protein